MHSTQLTCGRYADGTPNAIFDGLGRVVCSFPTDRTSDTRKGSPSTPETIEANARLFCAVPELVEVARCVITYDEMTGQIGALASDARAALDGLPVCRAIINRIRTELELGNIDEARKLVGLPPFNP